VIRVCVDDRIRFVSSLLALTVGNAEIEEWAHPHPMRLATQKYLETMKSHPCFLTFDEICRSFPPGIPPGAIFYPVAILLKGPPSFAWDVNEPISKGILQALGETFGTRIRDEPRRTLMKPLITPILDASDELPLLFASFFEGSKIEESWMDHREWWKEAVQQCKNITSSRMIDQWLTEFYGESEVDLVLVPNLVDPPSDGFGLSRQNHRYAVVGPPSVPKRMDRYDSYHQYANKPQYVVKSAFHEFSHGLVKKFLNENPALIKRTEYLDKRNSYRGWFPTTYPVWPIQFEEIFIRATTALFLAEQEGESAAQKFLEREKEQHGIYAIDEFYDRLGNYIHGKRNGKFADLQEYLESWSRSTASE